jgi:hypothetical protein
MSWLRSIGTGNRTETQLHSRYRLSVTAQQALFFSEALFARDNSYQYKTDNEKSLAWYTLLAQLSFLFFLAIRPDSGESSLTIVEYLLSCCCCIYWKTMFQCIVIGSCWICLEACSGFNICWRSRCVWTILWRTLNLDEKIHGTLLFL